ncbi:hypothetical protein BH92_11010 [Rhodococcoides fascians A21d2]|nr:hypothetical protein BH92_11010 [Rhodococcus fascians A21d2]
MCSFSSCGGCGVVCPLSLYRNVFDKCDRSTVGGDCSPGGAVGALTRAGTRRRVAPHRPSPAQTRGTPLRRRTAARDQTRLAAIRRFDGDTRKSDGLESRHHQPRGGYRMSIMPGKVNPTQCEAMVMVCIQVIADDTAVAFAGTQGNFELNAMRPIIIDDVLHSATILGDMCAKFTEYCVDGIELNRPTIAGYVARSLMLVTALSPVIGYEKAARNSTVSSTRQE